MIMLAFFSWWYGRGWSRVASSFSHRLQAIIESFSVAQLSRSLFAPWRRIITPSGSNLRQHMQAWGDNLVSRGVGFIVRFFVLLAALVSISIVGILTIVELIIWPLLPLAVLGGLVWSVL